MRDGAQDTYVSQALSLVVVVAAVGYYGVEVVVGLETLHLKPLLAVRSLSSLVMVVAVNV